MAQSRTMVVAAVMRAFLLAFAVAWRPLAAQSPPSTHAEPGSELEIYLMTMGPGDMVWERFGHNALGIRDRLAGTDVVYNWGTFSFGQAGFLPRFLRGEMTYWVQAEEAERTIANYRYLNRSVWIQELNFRPAERLAIKRFVEENAREENRYYRYDYFRDNCSTRVRDALDRALGGQLRARFAPRRSGMSYRDEARRLMEPDPLIYTGIEIGLGSPSDAEMSGYDLFYIPMRLRDGIREIRREASSEPLVLSETEVFRAVRPEDSPSPRSFLGRYFVVAALVAGVMLLAGLRERAGGPRWRLTSLGVLWCAAVGVFGLLLMGLWGFTAHVWAHRNVNLLLVNPLWFLLIPMLRARAPRPWMRALFVVVAALAALGTVVGLTRLLQRSEHVVALFAPVHATLLALVAKRWQRG